MDDYRLRVIVLSGFAVLSLVVCGTGGWFAFQWWDWMPASRQLPAAYAKAKELGIPLTAKDLAPRPPVKESENAAPAIRLMGVELKKIVGHRSDVAAMASLTSPKDDAALEKKLQPFAKVLAALEKAVSKPRLDFHRDWDLGPSIRFPEYADTKLVSKLLAARAELRARQGNVDGALSDLRSIQRLSTLIGSEPNLISMLVEQADRKIGLAAFEQVSSAWHLDDDKLERLQRELERLPVLPSFGDTFRYESYITLSTIRNLQYLSLHGDTDQPRIDPRQIVRDGMPEEEKARALMTRHLQTWARIWPILTEYRNEPIKLVNELKPILVNIDSQRGVSYMVVKLLTPPVAEAGYAVAALDANQRAELELVKALRYRLRTGRYPASISTKDPFTDKPLHMKIKGESIRIYSVGKNRKDDGGWVKKEIPLDQEDRSGDVVATYPPIAR